MVDLLIMSTLQKLVLKCSHKAPPPASETSADQLAANSASDWRVTSYFGKNAQLIVTRLQ
jgi:hypothetical protein